MGLAALGGAPGEAGGDGAVDAGGVHGRQQLVGRWPCARGGRRRARRSRGRPRRAVRGPRCKRVGRRGCGHLRSSGASYETCRRWELPNAPAAPGSPPGPQGSMPDEPRPPFEEPSAEALPALVEALLFVADGPTAEPALARALGAAPRALRDALDAVGERPRRPRDPAAAGAGGRAAGDRARGDGGGRALPGAGVRPAAVDGCAGDAGGGGVPAAGDARGDRGGPRDKQRRGAGDAARAGPDRTCGPGAGPRPAGAVRDDAALPRAFRAGAGGRSARAGRARRAAGARRRGRGPGSVRGTGGPAASGPAASGPAASGPTAGGPAVAARRADVRARRGPRGGCGSSAVRGGWHTAARGWAGFDGAPRCPAPVRRCPRRRGPCRPRRRNRRHRSPTGRPRVAHGSPTATRSASGVPGEVVGRGRPRRGGQPRASPARWLAAGVVEWRWASW